MTKCVIEKARLDKKTIEALVQKFVNDELCPCAVETFAATEKIKDALYNAVINEMVLRGLSKKMAAK